MSPLIDGRTGTTEAVRTLTAYLAGLVALDELIEWAERLEAVGADNPWLRRLAADLANPLLCREQAMALVHEHLRSGPGPNA